MKGKILLGSLVTGIFITTGYQTQIELIVSAETKELVSSQQGAVSSVAASNTAVSTTSGKPIASTSSSVDFSTEEIMESESVEWKPTASITTSKESEKATEESVAVASQTVPEAVVKDQISVVPATKVEENYQLSVTKNQTTEEFIQTIGKDAQAIAWNEDIYASVMIAQAILETGSGNSQLARPPYHNLFGIKGSYQGKQVSFSTQEDKGDGQLYTIRSAFRQYPSYKDSLEDYASLLKKGPSGNTGFYQETWKSNAATFREAAKALTGKYATDTAYDKKLIALIEAYNLSFYDQEPVTNDEVEQEKPATDQIKSDAVVEEKQMTEASNESSGQEIQVNQTKQPVIVIPPAAQRPANQLTGNRIVQ
ncbi:glucosaminidase domain-containing protein [Enterococcus sp. AZ072]|uniref:glucosaminidase domain-containing protein n=1 Tax=unclassified Enterococcus TaxID=2608891 RepID=UPI003D274A4C